MLRRAQADAEQAASGQIGLFGGGEWPGADPACPRHARLAGRWRSSAIEAEAIGFHLTAHPLDAYAAVLVRLGAGRTDQLETLAARGVSRVKLAGIVINSKERPTRTGSRMAWVRISDTAGSCEVTFFSEVLGRARPLLTVGAIVLVTADLRREDEVLRITAQDVVVLDEAAAGVGTGMRVWLERSEAVEPIRVLLGREGRGRGRVVLVPRLDASQSVEIALPGGFNVTPRLAQALKVVPGVERVEQV